MSAGFILPNGTGPNSYILRNNALIKKHAVSFVEHCDWMPFLLTGGKDITQMKRSVCTAGHKALWAEDWGGYPPDEFFTSLDPLLIRIMHLHCLPRLIRQISAQELFQKNGRTNLGLNKDVIIGIGAMDAHMGAVGGQIEPYFLSKVMGTSTCDMLVAPVEDMKGKYVHGICGIGERFHYSGHDRTRSRDNLLSVMFMPGLEIYWPGHLKIF